MKTRKKFTKKKGKLTKKDFEAIKHLMSLKLTHKQIAQVLGWGYGSICNVSRVSSFEEFKAKKKEAAEKTWDRRKAEQAEGNGVLTVKDIEMLRKDIGEVKEIVSGIHNTINLRRTQAERKLAF